MALTRKMLKAMGIEEDKIDEIIEAHAETVDALKDEVKNFKADSEELKKVKKELDELKSKDDDGIEEKYNTLKKEYDDFRTATERAKAHSDKEAAYRKFLKDVGIREKYIDAICRADQPVIDGLNIKDGKIEDSDKLIESTKNNWSDFIGRQSTQNAKVENPPANNGGNTKTKEEIIAIRDTATRQKMIADNPTLFGLPPKSE